MTDETKPVPLDFGARDVANMVAGGLFDLAGYIQRNYIVDPRAIMAEMSRLAELVQRLPVPQMAQGDGSEQRPN